MSYVVRCADLEELYQRWTNIRDAHRNELPKAKFKRGSSEVRQSEVRQMAADLANFSRIQWFHYSQTRSGVALRLYDNEFRLNYPQHYPELPKENGEEWVVLRGTGLGPPDGPCKKEMLKTFEVKWKASKAPVDPHDPREHISLVKQSSKDRIAYFEHPNLNNALGANASLMPTSTQSIGPDLNLSHADALRQFGQVIFYGPPGTGKTRIARHIALEMLAPGSEVPNEEELSKNLDSLSREDRFNLVVFHPAYEYEQFVGGVAPIVGKTSGLEFAIKPGVFLKMARQVERSGGPAVLIIDEINRGNLPKLLGELLYALEYRGAKVRLPFEWEGRSDLVVPKDLYIIGTMNSSDRSIGHVDVAVRRRFGLIHVAPDANVVRDRWNDVDREWGEKLARLLTRLNEELSESDRGGELRVGHAYFLPDRSSLDPKKEVQRKWFYQVRQLLKEYESILNLPDDFFLRFPETLNGALANLD